MLRFMYESLLRLYPDEYQAHYSKQMLQTMDDIIDDEKNPLRRGWLLTKEIVTTPLSAIEQYLIVFSSNRHITPKTIVSLGALLLLLPFMVALTSDEISEFLTGGHLYDSWLWSRPVLTIWIFVLPFISLVVSLSMYIISLIRQRKHQVSLLAKRYWLTIVTILFSAGILLLVVFHDSVHCWTGSTPISNVLTCTESGILGGDSH